MYSQSIFSKKHSFTMVLATIFMSLALLAIPKVADAADYEDWCVDPTDSSDCMGIVVDPVDGVDTTGDGGSAYAPYKTVQHAINAAANESDLYGRDITIHYYSGKAPAQNQSISSGGLSHNNGGKIIIEAYANVRMEGHFNVSNTVDLEIKHFHFYGANSGVLFDSSYISNVAVVNNQFNESYPLSIKGAGVSGYSNKQYIEILDNYFEDCGITIQGNEGWIRIDGNTFTDTMGYHVPALRITDSNGGAQANPWFTDNRVEYVKAISATDSELDYVMGNHIELTRTLPGSTVGFSFMDTDVYGFENNSIKDKNLSVIFLGTGTSGTSLMEYFSKNSIEDPIGGLSNGLLLQGDIEVASVDQNTFNGEFYKTINIIDSAVVGSIDENIIENSATSASTTPSMGSEVGISIADATVDTISNNHINGYYVYALKASTGAQITNINSNRVSNAPNGFELVDGSNIESVAGNEFYHLMTFSPGGIGIHVTDRATFDSISGNRFYEVSYGIIVEESDGDFASFEGGEDPSSADEIGGAMNGAIDGNDFAHQVEVDIGLANVTLDSVSDNKDTEPAASDLVTYNTRVDVLNGNCFYAAMGDEVEINHSIVTTFTGNRFRGNGYGNSYPGLGTGVVITNGSIVGPIDGNIFEFNQYGLYIEESSVNEVVNSVFYNNSGNVDIYLGPDVESLDVFNNTFAISMAPIYVEDVMAAGAQLRVANNIFQHEEDTSVDPTIQIYDLSDLTVLDNNVYANQTGELIWELSTGLIYDFENTKTLGYNTFSYDTEGMLMVLPDVITDWEGHTCHQDLGCGPDETSGILQLVLDTYGDPGIYALSTAGVSYTTATDFFGNARPAGQYDMGATENQIYVTDADGDGVYADSSGNEVFGSSDSNTDTDGDGLSDYEEVYMTSGYATDPVIADTDGGGANDYDEIVMGTDPTDSTDDTCVDTDGDTVCDSDDAFPTDPTEWDDTDTDGVGDNSDAFPSDVAASVDTDEDGYPDNWNTGYTESDSTTGLTLDVFPSDATEWADADGDGYGDNSDAFPSDATEWDDTDSDGVGDNSDAFPSDVAASVDTDGDGYPDSWNTGYTESDSTTGLALDDFPSDATEWADADGDGYGDNLADTCPGSTDLTSIDSEGCDDYQRDSDEDGLSDGDEAAGTYGGYISDPNDSDSDDDGINDYDEVMGSGGYVTNPMDDDTDGDGYTDDKEYTLNSSPTDYTTTLHSCDTYDSSSYGTWYGLVEAENVSTDTTTYLEGSGSTSFDINADGAQYTYMYFESPSAFDLSSYSSSGEISTWVYIPDVTDFSYVYLQWGNDSSNMWKYATSTDSDGDPFTDGWNHVTVDWSGASVSGSPDATLVDYFAVVMGYESTYSDQSDFRIDSLVIE